MLPRPLRSTPPPGSPHGPAPPLLDDLVGFSIAFYSHDTQARLLLTPRQRLQAQRFFLFLRDAHSLENLQFLMDAAEFTAVYNRVRKSAGSAPLVASPMPLLPLLVGLHKAQLVATKSCALQSCAHQPVSPPTSLRPTPVASPQQFALDLPLVIPGSKDPLRNSSFPDVALFAQTQQGDVCRAVSRDTAREAPPGDPRLLLPFDLPLLGPQTSAQVEVLLPASRSCPDSKWKLLVLLYFTLASPHQLNIPEALRLMVTDAAPDQRTPATLEVVCKEVYELIHANNYRPFLEAYAPEELLSLLDTGVFALDMGESHDTDVHCPLVPRAMTMPHAARQSSAKDVRLMLVLGGPLPAVLSPSSGSISGWLDKLAHRLGSPHLRGPLPLPARGLRGMAAPASPDGKGLRKKLASLRKIV